MPKYNIPEDATQLLNAELRLATCFQNLVECAGGWPVADGLVCPHCHSDNPSKDCGNEQLSGSSGPGETYFGVGSLNDYLISEEKDMPVKRKKTAPPTEYSGVKSGYGVKLTATVEYDEEGRCPTLDVVLSICVDAVGADHALTLAKDYLNEKVPRYSNIEILSFEVIPS